MESIKLFESYINEKNGIDSYKDKVMRIKKGRTFEFRSGHSSTKLKEADGIYTGHVQKQCKTHPSAVWFKIESGPTHVGSTVMVKKRDLTEYESIEAEIDIEKEIEELESITENSEYIESILEEIKAELELDDLEYNN